MSDLRVLKFDEIYAKIIDHGCYIEIRSMNGDISVYFGYFKLLNDMIVQFEDFTHPLKRVGQLDESFDMSKFVLVRITMSHLKFNYLDTIVATRLRIDSIVSNEGHEYETDICYSAEDTKNCQFGVVKRYTPCVGEEIIPYDENRRGAFERYLYE